MSVRGVLSLAANDDIDCQELIFRFAANRPAVDRTEKNDRLSITLFTLASGLPEVDQDSPDIMRNGHICTLISSPEHSGPCMSLVAQLFLKTSHKAAISALLDENHSVILESLCSTMVGPEKAANRDEFVAHFDEIFRNCSGQEQINIVVLCCTWLVESHKRREAKARVTDTVLFDRIFRIHPTIICLFANLLLSCGAIDRDIDMSKINSTKTAVIQQAYNIVVYWIETAAVSSLPHDDEKNAVKSASLNIASMRHKKPWNGLTRLVVNQIIRCSCLNLTLKYRTCNSSELRVFDTLVTNIESHLNRMRRAILFYQDQAKSRPEMKTTLKELLEEFRLECNVLHCTALQKQQQVLDMEGDSNNELTIGEKSRLVKEVSKLVTKIDRFQTYVRSTEFRFTARQM